MKQTKTQTSETFLLSAILSLSGGFQDAYTYNLRSGVFANAQTGNVVLMSQHFLQGEWAAGLHYLFPVLSFALGVLLAEQLGHRFRNSARIHWRQIVLLGEIAVLLLAGFLPARHSMAANMLISLSCAMQVQAFRKVEGSGYASTMCIGNLRSGTESLSRFLRTGDPAARRQALRYYGIILVFALGAGLGGVLSALGDLRIIWLSCLLLLGACLMMCREHI